MITTIIVIIVTIVIILLINYNANDIIITPALCLPLYRTF